MNIEIKKKKVYSHNAREMIKRTFGECDEAKVKILQAVIENESLYQYTYSKKTVINRIAFVVIYPLFLCIVPFQWLFTGNTGFHKGNKFGRFILAAIGEE